MDPSMLEGLDEETRQSIELAMRLQAEEDARIAEQDVAAARMQELGPEDNDSIALAIRLQQEDDEQALRDALGVQAGEGDDDPGSPSQYSYEQLMRLQQTIGEVSRGASSDAIDALRTMSYEDCCNDENVILGDQVPTSPPSLPPHRLPPPACHPSRTPVPACIKKGLQYSVRAAGRVLPTRTCDG